MTVTLDEFFDELRPYRDTLALNFSYKPALNAVYLHFPSFYRIWMTITQRPKRRKDLKDELSRHGSYLHEKLVRIHGKPMRSVGLDVRYMSGPMLELLVPKAVAQSARLRNGGQHPCYCAMGLLITRGCQCGGI